MATIGLSLRDESRSPIEGPRIKLALMGLKPWAEPYSPFFGATNLPKDCSRKGDFRGTFGYPVHMSEESEPKTSEERAWQYFLQLQPSIADVNAAAELAFRAVDAFDRVLKRRRAQDA